MFGTLSEGLIEIILILKFDKTYLNFFYLLDYNNYIMIMLEQMQLSLNLIFNKTTIKMFPIFL